MTYILRDEAVKICREEAEKWCGGGDDTYGARQACEAVEIVLRSLPCRCPPVEGGLTREEIEYLRPRDGQIFGTLIQPEKLRALCDLALRGRDKETGLK